MKAIAHAHRFPFIVHTLDVGTGQKKIFYHTGTQVQSLVTHRERQVACPRHETPSIHKLPSPNLTVIQSVPRCFIFT